MQIESAADLRHYVREKYADATLEEQKQIYQALRTHPDRPAYCADLIADWFGKWQGKGTSSQWRKFLRRFDAARVIG